MTKPAPDSLEQLKRDLEAGVIDQPTFADAAARNSARLSGSGAIAQGDDALSVGAQAAGIRGDNYGDVNTGKQISAAAGAQIVYAEKGATVVIGEAPVTMTA